MISLIINTCSGDPLQGMPKYGRRSYRQRVELLHDEILPAAERESWDEILVVGQFVEPSDSARWTYVPMQPIYRDRRDALWQREFGARHSRGLILAFSHDDHAFAPGAIEAMFDITDSWDILVPRRVTLAGAPLDNGRAAGYMGGHSLMMKRAAWARTPWTSVDTEWWDTTMTRIWQEDGSTILWTDALTHIDMDG